MRKGILAVFIAALLAGCEEKKIEEARKAMEMPADKAGLADRSDKQGSLDAVETAKLVEPAVNKGGDAKKPYILLSTEQIAGNNQQLVDIISNLKDPMMGKKNKEYFSKLDAADQKRLLNEFLRHSNANVRIQSAQILLLLKKTDKHSIERFIEMIKYDPDRDVRAEIARVLMNLKAREAVDALIGMAEGDEYEMARANAIWALGNIGDKKAVPVIKKSLTDADGWVRLRSVSAVKKMKLRELTGDLIARLKDSSQMVRKRAHEALIELTGKNYGEDAEKWEKAYGGK